MKTLVCGRGAETGGRSVHVHIVQALRDLGHVVHGFDPLLHGDNQKRRMQNLASLMVHTSPEVLVHVPSGEDLDLEALQELTAELEVLTMAMSTGLTFLDAPVARHRLREFVATHDVVTTSDPSEKVTYSGPGSYAMFPMKASWNLLALDAASARVRPHKADVVVLGDADASNAHLVRQLLDADLKVEIVGEGWNAYADLRLFATCTGSLEDRVSRMRGGRLAVELPPTLSALSGVLMSREEVGICVLALEAVALGVPLLTPARPGVASHLLPGAQVFTWEQDGDVSALACMILSDAEVLSDVALGGQLRTRSDHRAFSRWLSFSYEFTLRPGPLVPVRAPADDQRVAVCVLVNEDSGLSDVIATLGSLQSQGTPANEIVIVSSVELPRQHAEGLREIVALEADDETLTELALSATTSGLVALARAGDVWCADRIESQVHEFRKHPRLDLSHGPALDASPSVVGGQSSLTRSLVDPRLFLPASFMVRRSSLLRLGSGRLLIGANDALIAATTLLRCDQVGQPLIMTGLRPSLGSELCEQPIASLYPEILESTDRRSAAAAAFTDLAARVAASDPSLARELVGLALDCLDELDLKLEAMYSGVVWPDVVLLEEQARRLFDANVSAGAVETDSVTPVKAVLSADSPDELTIS